MSVLEVLRQKNEYPIIFIGSGISRRYLENFPGWEELLEKFWKMVHPDKDFYAYLNNLRITVVAEMPETSENEINYYTNIKAGSEIGNSFNEKYFREEIQVENFSQRDAYRSKISPFKKALANEFSKYSIKPDMLEEYQAFQRFINKAQVLLTTNYDTFIEDSFNELSENGIKKFIGQRGFFEQTFGWAELFKLHGSVEDPESIVISAEDYAKFEKNSILISARIISLLINSPIIFIGYSLTDMNIRKIIRDFSSSLTPTEIKRMGSRIIIIDRVAGKKDVEEVNYYDRELDCEYTVLKTDNFHVIYDSLMGINQGITPAEVRRYQHVMKRLIVDRGKRGSLNTLLVAPEDLDDIETRLGNENIVVALGDTAYIFRMPDLMSYTYDYVFNKDEIHTDIALRFVANQNINSRLPFLKYVRDVDLDKTNLNSTEKEKIRQRITRYRTYKSITESIVASNRIKKSSLDEILSERYKSDKMLDVITYNAENLNFEELDGFIKKKLEELKCTGVASFSTAMRKLLLAYDFLRTKKEADA